MELPALDDYFSIPVGEDIHEWIQSMNLSQLKQQLRLRGLKVSGKKSELVQRLLNSVFPHNMMKLSAETHPTNHGAVEQQQQETRQMKEIINVTEYLDEEDREKHFRSIKNESPSELKEEKGEESAASSFAEVWGTEARINMDEDFLLSNDEDRRRLVVDCISRTVIDFKASNGTFTSAAIFATREALRGCLLTTGGVTTSNPETIPKINNNNDIANSMEFQQQTPRSRSELISATEAQLRDLQTRREREARRPVSREDMEVGIDEGDETGIFWDVLHREVSDWGKYTVTGAQLSAQEVQGVLLLSDVYGAFSRDVTALAEKIAFECQPVVVMVPDLFRGRPWTDDEKRTNERGQTYEEWRASVHDDLRVNVDVRAAAACLRQTYGVSSVVVWGMCYGGGRALEAASGWIPSVHDVDGISIGPPPVDPVAAIVWYPTRYHNARDLFGMHHRGRTHTIHGESTKLAIMGVFAEKDAILGATRDDAALLKELLQHDDRVVDHMIKVFSGQEHGFAHMGLGDHRTQFQDDTERFLDEEFGGAGRLSIAESDAEVACLLSTAFMETYSRVFLPTVGPPISLDESAQEWSHELTMKDLKDSRDRNIREEIEEALDSFVEEPLLSGRHIDPTDASQEEELANLLRSMQDPNHTGPFKIEDDDDLAAIYTKLVNSDENFQLF
jgi:dienelactone hydrolase